jgi:hypothetical protein
MGVAAGSVCQAFHPILPGSDSSAALSVREGGARGGCVLDRPGRCWAAALDRLGGLGGE